MNGNSLKDYDGILIPGGFGKRGIEGKIEAIQFARENNIPFLGLCLGFQLATVEFARHKAGITDATSEEFGEGTHVIALLPEQEGLNQLGGTMRLGDYTADLREGTLANRLYGQKQIVERHRHRYEVNPQHINTLEKAGLVFSATNKNRMEILELPGHPFFFATQFHPEFKSRPTKPSFDQFGSELLLLYKETVTGYKPYDIGNAYAGNRYVLAYNGSLELPGLGKFKAKGKKIKELEKEIIKAAKIFDKHPRTTINLLKVKTINIYVVGTVRQPPTVQLRRRRWNK